MDKLAVIIPAAGPGSRMGTQVPKPFLDLDGKAILEHTIQRFLEVDIIVQIIVATSLDWVNEVEGIFSRYCGKEVIFNVVLGGAERQFSISNALHTINKEVGMVAVHDAVRPFISKELIRKSCSKAKQYGGAIVAVPAKDTIKRVGNHLLIKETPNREELWQAQTPQIFRKELLVLAYKSAIKDNFAGTDDASLVERFGGKVAVVEGDRENLKITYPIDLKVAELILNNAQKS